MPRRAIRVRCSAFRHCPSPLGNVTHLQISVYRSVSMVNVGAAIRRPCGKILRIRIGFRRIRNMMLRGRSMIAPTDSIERCSINSNLNFCLLPSQAKIPSFPDGIFFITAPAGRGADAALRSRNPAGCRFSALHEPDSPSRF